VSDTLSFPFLQDWRHVYKSLAVLEFLVGHGSESAMREVRAMKRELKHLERFQFMDSQGKDQVCAVAHSQWPASARRGTISETKPKDDD
jgi:hypothetical protein